MNVRSFPENGGIPQGRLWSSLRRGFFPRKRGYTEQHEGNVKPHEVLSPKTGVYRTKTNLAYEGISSFPETGVYRHTCLQGDTVPRTRGYSTRALDLAQPVFFLSPYTGIYWERNNKKWRQAGSFPEHGDIPSVVTLGNCFSDIFKNIYAISYY